MELPLILLGLVCVAWSVAELAAAAARRAPLASFGVVDAEGIELDVVVDRRGGRSERRADPSALLRRA